MIVIDFYKAYDIIDQETTFETLEAMNIRPRIKDLVKLICTDSSATIVINDEKGIRFQTEGRVRQGFYLAFISSS